MAFIGNVPAESYITTVKDTFSGNGSTTAFTLSQPSVTNDVRVVVENVVQEPTTAYSVAGTTLTFTSAPPSGSNNVYVIHLGPAVQTTVPPETFGVGSIYGASDTDTAITFEGSGVTTFDQNGSEAMRILSDTRVVLGKTTVDFDTVGIALVSDTGQVAAVRDGGHSLSLNRKTSDGEIARFSKDGTTVGAIGTLGDDATIGTGVAGFRFRDSAPEISPHNMTANAVSDGLIDLGAGVRRFKDLYLSGGVYLGGTGSANYLDDYEEGTWTPTNGNGSGTVTFASFNKAVYTKIGNIVTVHVYLVLNSDGTTVNFRVGGLPFTVGSTVFSTGVAFVDAFTTGQIMVRAQSNETTVRAYKNAAEFADENEVDGGAFIFQLTYTTA